jgi:hypothetical protein
MFWGLDMDMWFLGATVQPTVQFCFLRELPKIFVVSAFAAAWALCPCLLCPHQHPEPYCEVAPYRPTMGGPCINSWQSLGFSYF